MLKALPDTPTRVQQELALQLVLGAALVAVKGYTTPDVEKTVTRARELCVQLGETPQLFPMLFQLTVFYLMRRGRELQTARELAEQLLRLAQSVQDQYSLSLAHGILGCTLYWCGELTLARPHLEQAIALYDPQIHPRSPVGTADPRIDFLSYASWALWILGYPDQALKRSHETLTLAKGLSHPYSLAYASGCAAGLHSSRREWRLAQECAEEAVALSTEQGFPSWLAVGTVSRGEALVWQGQTMEGIAQIRQGMAAYQATGSSPRPHYLALLAEACGKAGQVEEGIDLTTEALTFVDSSGERMHEAELYRLKGELTLQQESKERGAKSAEQKFENPNPRAQSLDPQCDAEACFLKAIEIAQRQQAKSLELRAVMSLVRLRQQQTEEPTSRTTQHVIRDRLNEAHQMLGDIYNWFTEGFDTKDLQEAKALIEELRQ